MCNLVDNNVLRPKFNNIIVSIKEKIVYVTNSHALYGCKIDIIKNTISDDYDICIPTEIFSFFKSYINKEDSYRIIISFKEDNICSVQFKNKSKTIINEDSGIFLNKSFDIISVLKNQSMSNSYKKSINLKQLKDSLNCFKSINNSFKEFNTFLLFGSFPYDTKSEFSDEFAIIMKEMQLINV